MIEEIRSAYSRISPYILNTPLFHSTYLSSMNKGEVFLKLESEQYTGSFKARGALNKVLKLTEDQNNVELVTASTGNHAQGFARALTIANREGTIYLPVKADESKVEALRQYNADLRFFGDSPLEAELHTKAEAEKMGKLYISPYNDNDVIAGQGTIALEITDVLDDIDGVFGCIGGGGMMSGISSWFKGNSKHSKIVGCLPENAPEMFLSVKKGKVVILEEYIETLSDGSAGGLEEGAITFDICRALVDTWKLVPEAKIASTIRYMVDKHHKIVEGSAAVAIGSFIQSAEEFMNQRVVIVVCGSNITTEKLTAVL